MSSVRAAIAGPSECGKSTLAHATASAITRLEGRRHIVMDPQEERGKWPPGSFVTADGDRFQAVVSASRNCCVWIEDASATINRDRSLSWLFTRIRHNGHMLYVLCHSATDLLPGMRNCLTEAFLFRQTARSAEWWADVFMENGLLAAQHLPVKSYEFLHYKPGEPVVKRKLKLCKP
jgi:energy-coupling factor transporter ATP-binding protein EcfA2